jgi:hypothetical protein
MTLVTAAMPSPLTRTTLPGTARAMPWHEVRQVTASTTGRGAEADAAVTVVAGACVVGAAPPVGDCASAVAGTEAMNAAMAKDRRAAARRRGGRAGRSTGRLAAYGVS